MDEAEAVNEPVAEPADAGDQTPDEPLTVTDPEAATADEITDAPNGAATPAGSPTDATVDTTQVPAEVTDEATDRPAAVTEVVNEPGEAAADPANAPVDVTDAFVALEPPGTMAERALEWLQLGGPVVMILLVMSIAALAIVLVKLWQFRRARLGDERILRETVRLYRAGREREALVLAAGARNPVGQALARAIRGQRRGLAEARVREEVFRFGGDVLETLKSGLRPLEVIASLAPLLGLFGTVLGMIEAFRELEAAGNQVNPAVLSGGIWAALLTTAVGLAVAIPVVAVLSWLERRVDRVAYQLESSVTQIFTDDLASDPATEDDHAPRRIPEPAATVAAG